VNDPAPMPKRVSPQEAKQLIDQGWAYVDVRNEDEFAAGHPEGAYNVPVGDILPAAVEKLFGDKSTRVVVGCLAGGRSLRAATMLEQAGWTNIVDQRAGFGGTAEEKGWRDAGLPVATRPEPGRSWKEIGAKR
jgi:rhodanese-related sulfurtransferase